ncbi:hypothetical protein WAF17_06540 [Bernardetia sp. ABR2-2B]|uniref:hypothetical protein n=1 Tax=Bernardetia sp. ABR2-2B TaxID=3127472 RepID=UPI0030CFAB8F
MLIALLVIVTIIFTPIVLLILTGVVFSLFNRGKEFKLFLKSIFSRVWISPIYLFEYSKRNT